MSHLSLMEACSHIYGKLFFSSVEILTLQKFQKVLITLTYLDIQMHFFNTTCCTPSGMVPINSFQLVKYFSKRIIFFLEFFHQGLNRQFYTWGGPFNRKVMGLDPCVGILINPKAPKNIKFDISRFSNSYFSMPIGLTSFIRILIDSFFLSVEWLLNRNSFVFAKATDFSLLAESIEKCYCQCNSVDIQIHRFLKLSAWILPTRSQSTTFFLVKILVKILCCVFHHTIRLRLLSKNNLFFLKNLLWNFVFMLLIISRVIEICGTFFFKNNRLTCLFVQICA